MIYFMEKLLCKEEISQKKDDAIESMDLIVVTLWPYFGPSQLTVREIF